MKLLAKTNKYYLAFIFLLVPIMILADFLAIKYFVNDEINDMLIHESERIIQHIHSEGTFPTTNYPFDTITLTQEYSKPYNQFDDTLIYINSSDQQVAYRTYEFALKVNTHFLKVTLRHVLIEAQELIVWVFISTSAIIIIMIAGLFLVNHLIAKWVWKPFYQNLIQLQHFDLNRGTPIELARSNVREFNVLNEIITTLMNQIKKDYQNLKDFNEHISHDMQTPLAIIRNKMILLLENQQLNEKELNWAQSVYQEANKLSKIVKSLSLISRIENHEFKRRERVDVKILTENIISNMDEIIKFKHLLLQADLKSSEIDCDPLLANILFTNLIKNAVQHNKENGYIKLYLDQEKFEIENTGEILNSQPEQLFNRFEKGNMLSDSIGLGLSINQRICEMYGFKLDYHHHEGTHLVSLHF